MRMFVRLLAVVILVCLLAAPACALAKAYDLWIGETQFTDACLKIYGITGVADYDPQSNTLYLSDFTLNSAGAFEGGTLAAGIYCGMNSLTVSLSGSSKVEAGASPALSSAEYAVGLYAKGSLSFKGKASAEFIGGASDSTLRSFGVYAQGDLTMTEGSVTGRGGGISRKPVVNGPITPYSCGVVTTGGKITLLNNAALEGHAGVSTQENSGVIAGCGLSMEDNAYLEGSAKASSTNSYGVVVCSGTIRLQDNAQLVGKGGPDTTCNTGVYAGTFVMDIPGDNTPVYLEDNAKITGSCEYAVSSTTGLFFYGDLTAQDNAQIVAIGGPVGYGTGASSAGVRIYHDHLTLKGSAKMTATGGSSDQPNAASYGVYVTGSVNVSGKAELNAVCSDAPRESKAVCCSGYTGAVVEVEGDAKLTAFAGESSPGMSFGVYTFSYGGEVGTKISGGVTEAYGVDGGFDKAPAVASAYTDAALWYGEDEDAADIAGEQPIEDVAANYSQPFVRIAPEGFEVAEPPTSLPATGDGAPYAAYALMTAVCLAAAVVLRRVRA